jgi:hypothetical protein
MSDPARPRPPEPPEGLDDVFGIRNRLESIIPGMLRRTVGSGPGSGLRDEVIRNVMGEMKLPREAVTYLVQVAEHTKREVVRVAAREFREFLESANVGDEVARILTKLSFEIRTEVRYVPNEQALKPSVSSKVRVVSNPDEPPSAPDEPSELGALDEAIRAGAQELADRLLGRGRRAAGPTNTAPAAAPETERSSAPRRKATSPAKAGAKSKAPVTDGPKKARSRSTREPKT